MNEWNLEVMESRQIGKEIEKLRKEIMELAIKQFYLTENKTKWNHKEIPVCIKCNNKLLVTCLRSTGWDRNIFIVGVAICNKCKRVGKCYTPWEF